MNEAESKKAYEKASDLLEKAYGDYFTKTHRKADPTLVTNAESAMRTLNALKTNGNDISAFIDACQQLLIFIDATIKAKKTEAHSAFFDTEADITDEENVLAATSKILSENVLAAYFALNVLKIFYRHEEIDYIKAILKKCLMSTESSAMHDAYRDISNIVGKNETHHIALHKEYTHYRDLKTKAMSQTWDIIHKKQKKKHPKKTKKPVTIEEGKEEKEGKKLPFTQIDDAAEIEALKQNELDARKQKELEVLKERAKNEKRALKRESSQKTLKSLQTQLEQKQLALTHINTKIQECEAEKKSLLETRHKLTEETKNKSYKMMNFQLKKLSHTKNTNLALLEKHKRDYIAAKDEPSRQAIINSASKRTGNALQRRLETKKTFNQRKKFVTAYFEEAKKWHDLKAKPLTEVSESLHKNHEKLHKVTHKLTELKKDKEKEHGVLDNLKNSIQALERVIQSLSPKASPEGKRHKQG